jgi:flagellar hook protein FlgE
MFSGVSGLFSQSSQMSAISDNIANANTVGYKRTDVPFSTMVTTQGLKHSYAAGGVRANPRMHVDQQGQMQATQSNTDLALNGSGFFVVNTSAEPITGNIANRTLFTRAGSFTADANGDLRNTAGLYLQGWKLDSGGEFLNGEPPRTSFDSLETVNVTGLNFTGAPTTQVTFAGNLPAGETGQELPGEPIVTGVEYFDPLGNPQTMNMQWTPGTQYGSWTLDLIPAGETVPLASYQIDFNTSGPDSGTPASIREVESNVGRMIAETNTDNPDGFTGDIVQFDLAGMTAFPNSPPDLAVNVGTQTINVSTTAGDTPESAAQKIETAINTAITGGGTELASVSRSGSVLTIQGTNDANGADIASTITITGGTPATLNGTVSENNPNTLTGDTIEIDVEGQSAIWEDTDEMTLRVNGVSFPLDSTTTPALDTSSDAALATSIEGRIIDYINNVGPIPGVSVANVSAAGSTVTIVGDNDADGAGLAGLNEYAVSVTRDTRQNSEFVDEDGLNVNPLDAGDPIIARINADLPGGETQVLDFDLGEIGTLDGMTQFAGDYTPTLIERDGAQFGSLDRLEIDAEGVMTAIFNNGQTRPIYRIPVAEFTNPNGMLPVDGNAFQPTAQAGAYYLWDAGNGPAGEMISSSLESSTVDIAEEFSNMIIAQRAYSSNARIIQTADEMLQEITNLKR